ncbi:MAG: 6-bladed beta-propeller [Gemmatimonadales bacterium]|nr:6-bladed beta-propeller [Gemmatimonadales bacterium]
MTFRPLSDLALLLFLASCRVQNPPENLGTVVDSSGAFPVLTAPLVVPEWRAEPVGVVASAGGEGGEEEFGTIRSVLLAADGTLYVVDPSRRSLSVFDSSGRFIRLLGREGSGPGEYRAPYSIAWIGNSLALLDPRNGRLGLFDSTGAWLTSWPVPSISGGQFIRLYRTPPTAWAFATSRDAPDGAFIEYTASGPTDTIPLLVPEKELSSSRQCQRPDNGTTWFPQPFGASLIQIPAGAGARVLAITSAYLIAVVDPKGDTIRVIKRATPPAPITDQDWAQANADWTAFRQEWPTATCDRGDFTRPDAKPPVAHLFLDDTGRLWVERTSPDGRRYDLYSARSILLATVVGLPASDGIDPTVAGDRIAFVSHDSEGSPVVRLFRVRP